MAKLNFTPLTDGSSYVQKSGDTMNGDLNLSSAARIIIKKTDNNKSDHIQFYNGTTRVGEIGVQDTTWLIVMPE